MEWVNWGGGMRERRGNDKIGCGKQCIVEGERTEGNGTAYFIPGTANNVKCYLRRLP